MATILDLTRNGCLFKLDPELDASLQEERLIYGSPGFKTWVEADLPSLQSQWEVQEAPVQQLDALVEVFCSGEVLKYGKQFRPLKHIKYGVWELKTSDLRIFGWFAHKDCFVAVFGGDATYIKAHDLYPGYLSQTVRFRELLDLDEPKFIPGDHPHDVVSNFTYP
jgi:hypothetical protein